jgi:hypothetical protein
MSHSCPTSDKDERPGWGLGCANTNYNGVWGNNHSAFFHSEWALKRDQIAGRTCGRDFRHVFGAKFKVSSALGCPDDNAVNYNPYKKQSRQCTALEVLSKARSHTHHGMHGKYKVPPEPDCSVCDFPAGKSRTPSKKCSVVCSCSSAGVMTPYGKYSARDYTGCPGEVPCDPVDSIAQVHDWCVTMKGALSCACAHFIHDGAAAAGKHIEKHPKDGFCPDAKAAAKEVHFEAGLQWGACEAANSVGKAATWTCKKLWLEKLGVDCGEEPVFESRFIALDNDRNGEISAQELHNAMHKVHGPAWVKEMGSLPKFQSWHNSMDKDSSGGLSREEYRLTWPA